MYQKLAKLKNDCILDARVLNKEQENSLIIIVIRKFNFICIQVSLRQHTIRK